MIFTDQDLQIVSIAELCANLSATTLAEEHNLPDYKIRYALSNLKNLGVIQRSTAVVNYSRFQRRDFSFCLSLVDTPKSRETVKQRISAYCSENNLSLLPCYGAYQYHVSGSTSSLAQVRVILSEVSAVLEEPFSRQGFYLRLDTAYLQRGYLRQNPFERSVIKVPFNEKPLTLESKEEKILNYLSTEEVCSLKDLADEADCSISVARVKVSKLEEMGLICGYMHVLNPWLLGRLPAVLLLTTDSTRTSYFDELLQICKEVPSAVCLTSCLGRCAYEVRLEVASMSEAFEVERTFTQRLGPKLIELSLLIAEERGQALGAAGTERVVGL